VTHTLTMSDAQDKPVPDERPRPPVTQVAPSPHVDDRGMTTRRMMVDVLIALAPLVIASLVVFRSVAGDALLVMAICVAACVVTELLFAAVRRKPVSVADCSAVVTGLILALSLPWSCPWYVCLIAGVSAMVLGKMVFGGLGQNIFNPAMVGRAFVMICFASALGAKAYVGDASLGDIVVTHATPLAELKDSGAVPNLLALFFGTTNGSLGETSAIACLLGGLYLCVRRTASWEIPLGVILATGLIAAILQLNGSDMTVLHHLLGGALLFGAFFIATDPVSSPLTPRGKFIFGLGVGGLIMLLRTLSNYPEGVMFSVLVMNAFTPLINRWTIPTPVGGPVPKRA